MSDSSAQIECLICAGTSVSQVYSHVYKGKYRVVGCSRCGFAFAHPRPTVEELARLYGEEYHSTESDGLGYANYRDLGELNMRNMWAQFGEHLPLTKIAPRRILDVGCATGAFLNEAKKSGFEVMGIEFADEAADVARNEYGVEVRIGQFDQVPLDAGSFGLVTMWHIMEHLLDPTTSFKRAYEVLAPGGYLFIEVPNWSSLGRLVRKEKWLPLKPPEHINFFTPNSIATAARNQGFEVVKAWSIYPSFEDKAKIKRPSQPLYQLLSAAGGVVCLFGGGGLLRLLARKPA